MHDSFVFMLGCMLLELKMQLTEYATLYFPCVGLFVIALSEVVMQLFVCKQGSARTGLD